MTEMCALIHDVIVGAVAVPGDPRVMSEFNVIVPDNNVSSTNVCPTSGRQYRRWDNIGPTYIAVGG